MIIKGYLTSYVGLFQTSADGSPDVSRVEIPLIQRDYAQGRLEASVAEIRTDFLQVLLDAIAGGEPVGLDFVYGRVHQGSLRPLDGQQRLTTLFLVHWYLASSAGCLETGVPWARLSYATRPSARLFCQRLAANPLPAGREDPPSAWIVDQPWYLFVWRHDPTIQAMHVMLDSIHRQLKDRYPDLDPSAAWQRLTDRESPAVSFHLLPLDDIESDEALYITMNSRGKPLTEFESFKARFEQDIAHSDRKVEFAHKIDGAWSELLWPIHGGDNIVDDEFVRYLDFLTEICELREGRVTGPDRLGPRARAIFGGGNTRSGEHLGFLFHAFDAWRGADHVRDTFDGLLTAAPPGQDGYDPRKVLLHGAASTNLFEQCCHRFDSQTRRNRPFTLQNSLMLYAVLLHVIEHTADFPRRLRVLRNLVAAAEDEVRRENMPELISDVDALIRTGDLDAVKKFPATQVEDERLKQVFLAAHPNLTEALFRLEDHPILRGTLSVFELDPMTFEDRALAFEAAIGDPESWSELTGAMLATGDYQRPRPRSGAWQFGTSSPANVAMWRYLLTEAPRVELAATREVLGRFLDGFAHAGDPLAEHCANVMSQWLVDRENSSRFDWRHYLVKYPRMRSGKTGIYYGLNAELGYSMCMMRTRRLTGNYRDPILLQVWQSCGVGDDVTDPWFTGWETTPRWLRLKRSGAGLRSVADGFELLRPDGDDAGGVFDRVCSGHPNVSVEGDRLLMRIPQRMDDGSLVDTVDRVVIGAALVGELVEAGL